MKAKIVHTRLNRAQQVERDGVSQQAGCRGAAPEGACRAYGMWNRDGLFLKLGPASVSPDAVPPSEGLTVW